MKRITFMLGVSLFIILNAVGQSIWKADPTHTKIQFAVKHMMISEVMGHFDSYDVTVKSDKPDFTDAEISVSIDAKSINTGIEKRDEHLRSPDFFDVEKYPKITFEAKGLKKQKDGTYLLKGNLTIKDVTKPVELKVEHLGTIKDPWGNTRAGFKVTGQINRYDFGLKWNMALEAGGFVVDEIVKIIVDIELVKQQ